MNGFVFETAPRTICEDAAAERLGPLAAGMGRKRVMVVTDPGLKHAGLIDGPLQSLRDAGVEPVLFSEVLADPPQACVERAVEIARAERIDGVVGLGGGSSMDTAKLVALLVGSNASLAQVWGVDVAQGPRLPLIQVPTTAGTGSEVTPIAIVTTPTDEKRGVVTRWLLPDLALLDPVLTTGLPPAVTAATGVDAMVHAIEAYTSRIKKNPVSDALALRALTLLSGSIRVAVKDGKDLDARRAMLQGAYLAGMAFANAPVGAVHALAYPLGGRFHVPHGLSNALVLLPVLQYNLPAAEPLYAELAQAVAPAGVPPGANAAARMFFETMDALVRDMPMVHRLSDVGVKEDDLEQLATDAMQIERLLVNNPREMTHDAAVAIYQSVL
ncbi:MAG TPA: iron-containing alcohol dehydrogenase [Caulobacteraceae bacterium]|jgi:alcohol dehydrogenase class IV|nr:iron-containing alcohol dehydrogenase [Caulobacteraceae bacterium]